MPNSESQPANPEPNSPTPDDETDSKAHVGRVVLVAVLLATVLIGVGFFAYNAKDEPPAEPTRQTQSAEEIDTTSPVDEGAVDEETQQIDQTVEDLDNAADFNEQELSEASLGY
jgi:hypothetical protein